MEEINQYTVICKLREINENITLWEYEKDNTRFEALTIEPNEIYNRSLKRILQCEIKPLINRDITGMQKIFDVEYTEDEIAFIIYERLENYNNLKEDNSNAKLNSLKDILTALDTLKKENREIIRISPRTIFIDDNGNAKLAFVGLFHIFMLQNLLDFDLHHLPLSFLERLKGDKTPKPNFQDDMYSLIKSFEPFLRNLNDENADIILKTALSEKRTERFSKYCDILDLLDKINFIPNFDKILKIGMHPEKRNEFSPVIEEMNKKCYLMVENELSKNEKHDITGHFSTDNWHGRFFVQNDNYIRLTYDQGQHEKFNNINDNWFLADFSFSFYDNSTNFDAVKFFTEKFDKQNQLAELNKTKRESVRKWQTLPEKEKEYIEENAFKVKYDKFEIIKGTNAKFYLTKEPNNWNWEKVKILKNEGTILNLNDLKIGNIGDYSEGNFIVIKDILCTAAEIPEKGELVEDVRQKVSQFKKQVEACQKFSTLDVVNKDICSIFANPDTAKIPDNNNLKELDYDNFKENVFNPNLKTDDTQREAVLEALTYKPVYIIQGPPGTGKTTVIVELIRQIIKRQNNAKILVTSQSNLAVDNVLERIEEVNRNENQNLLFMRLASESEDKGINVTDTIIPHTYERKLKLWVNKTIQKSKDYTNQTFLELNLKKRNIIEFYDTVSNLKEDSFSDFKQKLNKSGNYIKSLFEKARNMPDVEKIFTEELGDKFINLRKIQKDWFAFLGNATNEKNKSMLNNGSEQIDFLTAMMKDVNIIGATCIHIASSKYSKINFKFDYVIMDESSKASPAEALVPINMGQNIILIGDHKQLPPVVTREDAVKQKVKTELEDNGLDVEKEFGESLFEKLIKAFMENEDKQKYVKMLDIQYRMPKQVGEIISKYFYDGKLKNPSLETIPNYDESKRHGLKLKKDTSIIFMSSSNSENCNDNGNKYKRQNKCNVQIIKEILAKLNESYSDNLQKEKPFTIGIIAGYRGQVELLKSSINLSQYKNFVKHIEINTVDKFQGAERDIIIYDIVRSDKGNANIGFLDDYRRINVAFSRVKRLLIIVGDSEYLIKRAQLNPGGRFKEFKLQQIAKDLQEQGFIFNSLEEVF